MINTSRFSNMIGKLYNNIFPQHSEQSHSWVKESLSDEMIKKYTQIFYKLHANPELGGQEKQTNKIIKDTLESFLPKYSIITFSDKVKNAEIANYGIIAKISGTKPLAGTKKGLIITADMDALPNNNDESHNGAAHNCGHDANMSGLLATAEILSKNKDKFSGDVFLIFTPSEEVNGGFGEMVKNGLFENPDFGLNIYKPEELYAITAHNSSMHQKGLIATRQGSFLSGNTDFKITLTKMDETNKTDEIKYSKLVNIKIIGKGGHGGFPHQAKTPIIPAMSLIRAISIPNYNNDLQITSISTGHPNYLNKITDDFSLSIAIKDEFDINNLTSLIKKVIDEHKDYTVEFTLQDKEIMAQYNPSIQAAQAIVSDLYNILPTDIASSEVNVLSPTFIASSKNGNVTIAGTSRYFTEVNKDKMQLGIKLRSNQAQYYGVKASIETLQDSYPPTDNTNFTTDVVNALKDFKLKIDDNAAQMGGRDAFPFPHYYDKVKHSTYMFAGTKTQEGEVGMHNPQFKGKPVEHMKTAVPAFLAVIHKVLGAST